MTKENREIENENREMPFPNRKMEKENRKIECTPPTGEFSRRV
jgi:hypothetical protein